MQTAMRLFGITVVSVTLLAAQGGMCMRGGGGQKSDPQERGSRKLAHLSIVLDLTDDQKAAATKIFGTPSGNSEADQKEQADLREKWQGAIKENNVALIDELASQWAELMAKKRADHAKGQAEFLQLLTADQRAKLDQLRGAGIGMQLRGGRNGCSRGMKSMRGGESEE